MGCPGTWAGSEGWVLASTDAIEPPHDAYRVALYQIRPSLPIRPAGKPLAAHSERIKPRFPLHAVPELIVAVRAELPVYF